MNPRSRPSPADVERTRKLWAANKPGETAAPAYVPDPPPLWTVAAALVLALLVQATFAPLLAIRGAFPSLVTLVVLWYGARTGSLAGLAFGLLAGACEDALAGTTGCAWTFATGLAGLAAGRIAGTWLADTKLVLVPLAAALTLGRYVVFAVLMQAQGRPLALPLAHFHVALWQSAFDALAALAVLWYLPGVGGSGAHRR